MGLDYCTSVLSFMKGIKLESKNSFPSRWRCKMLVQKERERCKEIRSVKVKGKNVEEQGQTVHRSEVLDLQKIIKWKKGRSPIPFPGS